MEAAQALVADGDPVGVPAEVVEDLLGAGEGSLLLHGNVHPVAVYAVGRDAAVAVLDRGCALVGSLHVVPSRVCDRFPLKSRPSARTTVPVGVAQWYGQSNR